MDTQPDASMNLRDSIEFIRQHEKELRLFNVDPADVIHEALRTYFETQNVRITVDRTGSGKPEAVSVLSNATGVLAVVKVATLRELLGDAHAGTGGLGIADGEYDAVLRFLKETTFTSFDTEQLLYASREIEDRARRTGQGSIHAGFQRCSVMGQQRSVYTDLSRHGVAVHAYGVPDASPPDFRFGRVHAVSTDEIARTWFVVFDGGGDETQKTALLAREHAGSGFDGSWTYDPAFVDHILGYLNRTYAGTPDDALSGR